MIDDVFRNENGIRMQMTTIMSIIQGEEPGLGNASKLFFDIVRLIVYDLNASIYQDSSFVLIPRYSHCHISHILSINSFEHQNIGSQFVKLPMFLYMPYVMFLMLRLTLSAIFSDCIHSRIEGVISVRVAFLSRTLIRKSRISSSNFISFRRPSAFCRASL